MPLFMIIAGYFSNHTLDKGFVQLIKYKAIQLLLPCFTWSFIMFLFNIQVNDNSPFGIFWFLPCLFICYTLLWFVKKVRNKLVRIILIFLLSIITGRYHFPQMFICFALGSFLYSYPNLFSSKVLLIVSGLVFLLILSQWHLLFNYPLYRLMDVINSNITVLGSINHLLILLIGISGALFCICIFNTLLSRLGSDNYRLLKFISVAGGKTLGIYVIQEIVLEKIVGEYVKLDTVNSIVSNYIIFPCISIGMIYVSVIILNTVEKSKYLSLMLFGSNSNKILSKS